MSLAAEETLLLARCARMGTSTWSDALDACGIAGVLQGIERRSGDGIACGFATTAQHTVGALGEFERADFAVGRLVGATGPGRILVVAMDGAPVSTFGGLAALAAAARQASGVVIDGACRDLDEIRASGLAMATRWVVPTTGKTRVRLRSMGEPVRLGPCTVSEGDLVVFDDTGTVAVPRAALARVLEAAERIHGIDLEVERGIRQGRSFGDAAAAADYIPAQREPAR